MIIAGIGSRQTPFEICEEMQKIGAWCQANNIIVRSGHAPGADQYFELGAQEFCIAYMPWSSFNNTFSTSANYRVLGDDQYAYVIAAKYHPAFDKLSFGVKKLIARDSYQVLGDELTNPVDAVVCYTKDGKASGGTGQAIRIANAYNVPVLNMFFEEYNTSDKVIAKLKAMLK